MINTNSKLHYNMNYGLFLLFELFLLVFLIDGRARRGVFCSSVAVEGDGFAKLVLF
jgi:hypothetical protein